MWCDECSGQGLARPQGCGGLRARAYRPEAKVCFLLSPASFSVSPSLPSHPDSEAPEMDVTGKVSSSDMEKLRISRLNWPKLSRKCLLCYSCLISLHFVLNIEYCLLPGKMLDWMADKSDPV